MLPHRSRLFILTGIRISSAVLHNFNLLGGKEENNILSYREEKMGEESVENKSWILLAMEMLVYRFIGWHYFFPDFQPGLI